MLMAPLSLLIQTPQRGHYQLIFFLVTLGTSPLTTQKLFKVWWNHYVKTKQSNSKLCSRRDHYCMWVLTFCQILDWTGWVHGLIKKLNIFLNSYKEQYNVLHRQSILQLQSQFCTDIAVRFTHVANRWQQQCRWGMNCFWRDILK